MRCPQCLKSDSEVYEKLQTLTTSWYENTFWITGPVMPVTWKALTSMWPHKQKHFYQANFCIYVNIIGRILNMLFYYICYYFADSINASVFLYHIADNADGMVYILSP